MSDKFKQDDEGEETEYTSWYKIIGRNMRYFRRASGLSQQDIGEVLGVSYQQVQKYEHGINRFPIEKLYELQKFYGLPFEVFFRDLPPEGVVRDNTFHKSPDYRIYLQLRTVRDVMLKKKISRMIAILIEPDEKEKGV